jgi:pyrrolidone-carboxylate peptidase
MDKILITGFERFGDYKENVTEIISKKILRISNHSLEYMIFPVRIFSNGADNYGKQIIARAKEINAKAIISLGMGSDIRGLRIESQAINWVENAKYCILSEQKKTIDDSLDSRSTLKIDFGKWNISKIFSAFKEMNIVHESEISIDANSFCCNALMFRTLQAIQIEGCKIPYIYLNLPCSHHAIEGLPDFDKKKHLISIYDVEDILTILSMYYI